jgi:hypothetical protein
MAKIKPYYFSIQPCKGVTFNQNCCTKKPFYVTPLQG